MGRILIVDDEEITRFTLREILEVSGYSVTEARNGKECIDLQKISPFDLIITDILMPEKDGIETIIHLKRDYPGIKIVAISGGGNMDINEALKFAQEFGADRILAKPFSDEQLIEVVAEQLS